MKIVSLCPSLTELVFALERGSELVGVTEYCVHPAELVRSIEKLGGTKNPAVARIVALAPDVVLMNREENRVEDAEVLRAAGLRVHDSMPRTVVE
ncbi:MAG: helical backbone metal receptor, partial [Planctomycetota bacterium]